MIEKGVYDIYHSDNFQNYLKALSKFHNYSLNNVILILSQYPSASLVAGYSSWRDNFHRYVNKGEKAIKILAPYQVNVKKTIDDIDEHGQKIQTEEVTKVTKFRIVNVFDINQTNGEPLTDLELVHDLKGSSNHARALIAAIDEICHIPIEYKSEHEDLAFVGGAKGYYSFLEDKIVINKDLDDIQIAKTLTHEYAHSLLHKDTKKSQSQREIEAESLAFVICDHFDIDTSDYSFGYVASYAMNNEDDLKTTLMNIQTNAKEIINTIEPIFDRDLKIFNTQDKYFTPVEMETTAQGLLNDLIKDIEGTGLYDEIKYSDPSNMTDIKEFMESEVNHLLDQYEEKHIEAVTLYDCNENFKNRLLESIILHCQTDLSVNMERPFLENSMERKNYKALESIAKPLLDNDAVYIQYSSPGMMNLNIERIPDNKIAISHYGELNGDAMADPDVTFSIDADNHLLIPETYQNDYAGIFETKNNGPQFCDDLNHFTDSWINTIKASHYKINQVYTDEKIYSSNENSKDLYKYCKDHDIQKYAINPNSKDMQR